MTAVAGSGDTQFDLGFAAQNLRGTYRLTVGPNVTDAGGNLMNQDGDAINGETAGRLQRDGGVCADGDDRPAPVGFEGVERRGGADLLEFESAGQRDDPAGDQRQAARGAQHLLFNANEVGATSTQSAMLAVDLTGRDGDGPEPGLLGQVCERRAMGTFYVDLSGDGTNLENVWSVSLATTYTQLHAGPGRAGAAKGIARDGDLYIRFRDYNRLYRRPGLPGRRAGGGGGDLAGPQVVAHAPTTVAAGGGPLTNVV